MRFVVKRRFFQAIYQIAVDSLSLATQNKHVTLLSDLISETQGFNFSGQTIITIAHMSNL